MLDPALTIDDLRAEVARLQDLADTRLYRARAARIALGSVGIPRSEPVDVGAARAAGMIEDLRAEVDRLTAALAAAQPVVEWQEHTDFMGNAFWTCIRRPLMLRVQSKGWDLVAIYGESYLELDSGEETGPVGKAACEAAYRRACGLPAIPPCAG